MELVDRDGTVWSADGGVREALERFDNQFGHVFLREKAREEEEVVEEEAVDGLLALLVGKAEEEEEEEEEGASGPGAAVADAPKPKKINRRQLIIELPSFIAFLTLFIVALLTRRSIDSQYQQARSRSNSLRDLAREIARRDRSPRSCSFDLAP